MTNSLLKEQPTGLTPLIVYDCTLLDGSVYHWSTHSIQIGNSRYDGRVLKQSVFESQLSSDQGVDAIPRVTLVLANADGLFTQLSMGPGFKGASLAASFVFGDLTTGLIQAPTVKLFEGYLNPADLLSEESCQLSAANRLGLQRSFLPAVRVQRRCPWTFPLSSSQRLEGVDGGSEGYYSRFYSCGYSADQPNGAGNLLNGSAYPDCDHSRSACEARGMFSRDVRGTVTARFGGLEFVPASILVRGAGDKSFHYASLVDSEARYNDFVPMVYGSAWLSPLVVFGRNDGNLTRFEVLLGSGEIEAVSRVLVNDVEVPQGVVGRSMTGTGWYNVVSAGSRNGGFNLDFADSAGKPLGDPYGGLAYMSLVVPNRVNDGRSTPRIKVLLKGLRVPTFDSTGNYLGAVFSDNPTWILLDLLRRAGWRLAEIDLESFAAAAAYCSETITGYDGKGTPVLIPRFACNLVLDRRRSVAELVRAVRNCGRLLLRYTASGKLGLIVEDAIDRQQPAIQAWGNTITPLGAGYASYEFDDGSSASSAILRRGDSGSTFVSYSRAIGDTPNRLNVEFQDSFNEYQQDSLSIVDQQDVAAVGQEITGTPMVLGLPNADQAGRILKTMLDKLVRGNVFVEFDTSVKALGLQPGDLISVNYPRFGLLRQTFRLTKVAPTLNFHTAHITAQLHDDAWYQDSNGQLAVSAAAGRAADWKGRAPRPVCGTDPNGFGFDLLATETSQASADGSTSLSWTIPFAVPGTASPSGVYAPTLGLSPTIVPGGGNIAAGSDHFYAIAASMADGLESPVSFVTFASVPAGAGNSAVELVGLSFPADATAFHVYRGTSPLTLLRIATAVPLSGTFLDTGLPPTPTLPPDPDFDHVNVYWRLEQQPETAITAVTATSLSTTAIVMTPSVWRGKVLRITSGPAAGQESVISDNDASTVFLSERWATSPQVGDHFIISDSIWALSGRFSASPATVAVPNRAGVTVNILAVVGIPAKANNRSEGNANVIPGGRRTAIGA